MLPPGPRSRAQRVVMTLRTDVASARLRPFAIATIALVGLGGVCIDAPVASAGQAPRLARTSATATPVPDPKPTPPPKPDPKPKPTPPPPPPPSPPPAPPAAPQPPAPSTVAPAPAPQPTPRATVTRRKATVAPTAKRTAQRSRLRAPKKARRLRAPARTVKAVSRERSQAAGAARQESLARTAAPVRQVSNTDSSFSGAPLILVALFGLGLVMLGASAVPPARVPWPVIAEPLFVHRFDLALMGIGTIAIGLFCLNIAVLL